MAAVTEIPEHLLKRSASAKAKATGAAAPADAPAAAPGAELAPVKAAAAAVPAAPKAPAVPPPPKPDIPVVAAAKARKKIPSWAMLGLSILPVWGFMYVRSLTPGTVEASGPLSIGEEDWAPKACAGCHGGEGGGINGRQLSGGEVWKTFPYIEDQLNLIYTGSEAYSNSGVGPYGDASRGHLGYNGGYMPAQGENLTEYEILALTCHTRYVLNDNSRDTPAFALWCADDSPVFLALEDGSATFDTLDKVFAKEGVIFVGTKPRPGQSATN